MSVITSQPSHAVLDTPLAPVRRLIVLVTEQDWEQADSLNQIWRWAAEAGLDVLLLGLFAHAEEEPPIRRHLVGMAAAIRDSRVSVEIHVGLGDDWMERVRAFWQPGDILVCYQGEDGGIGQRPLDHVLRSNFDGPVYLLPARTAARPHQPGAWSNAVSTAGSIGVVVGFFFLQIRIVQLLHDWEQTALLALSVLFEVVLIWVWDSLTG